MISRGRAPRWRLVVVMALAASVLAACGSSPSRHGNHSHHTHASTTTTSTSTTTSAPTSSPGTSSTTAAAAPCSTGVLQVAAGGVDTSAGTAHLRFTLTNGGPDRCSLVGYPTVALFGPSGAGGAGAGSKLALSDVRLGGPPARVTLSAGEAAAFVLSVAEVPVNGAACLDVASLEVRPPDSSESLSLPDSFQACGTNVGVYPVTPSSS